VSESKVYSSRSVVRNVLRDLTVSTRPAVAGINAPRDNLTTEREEYNQPRGDE